MRCLLVLSSLVLAISSWAASVDEDVCSAAARGQDPELAFPKYQAADALVLRLLKAIEGAALSDSESVLLPNRLFKELIRGMQGRIEELRTYKDRLEGQEYAFAGVFFAQWDELVARSDAIPLALYNSVLRDGMVVAEMFDLLEGNADPFEALKALRELPKNEPFLAIPVEVGPVGLTHLALSGWDARRIVLERKKIFGNDTRFGPMEFFQKDRVVNGFFWGKFAGHLEALKQVWEKFQALVAPISAPRRERLYLLFHFVFRDLRDQERVGSLMEFAARGLRPERVLTSPLLEVPVVDPQELDVGEMLGTLDPELVNAAQTLQLELGTVQGGAEILLGRLQPSGDYGFALTSPRRITAAHFERLRTAFLTVLEDAISRSN